MSLYLCFTPALQFDVIRWEISYYLRVSYEVLVTFSPLIAAMQKKQHCLRKFVKIYPNLLFGNMEFEAFLQTILFAITLLMC